MILQLFEYNSFYNFIYVTKTFQLAIDRKLIYTVCLKTTYESLRVLEKNNIVLWNNDVQTFLWYAVEFNVVQTILETQYYLMNFNVNVASYRLVSKENSVLWPSKPPRHRLVTKGDARFNDTITYRNLL